MRYSRQIVLSLLALFLLLTAHSQTSIILTLKKVLQAKTRPAGRIQTLFALCEQGYSLHPDTLMRYAGQAREIAVSLHDRNAEVRSMYYQSSALTTKGLIDSSLNLANQCLEILRNQVQDPLLIANILNQKGRCYMRKSYYKEAIDMGYQVVEVAERNRDTLLQMKGKTLIGWAYLEMGQTAKALTWHLKALQTTSDTIILKKYGILFANLALNYNGLGHPDSSLFYIGKAVSYSRQNENLFALANSLAIQAQLYVRNGKHELAEAPLKEMVDIRKQIGDPFYIVSDMSQLSLFYAHNGHPEKGIALCEEGISIAREFKIDSKLFFLYSVLAENYKATNDDKKYAEVLEKIINLKDSVYARNSAESLAEMQTKYEVQKKENLIILQKLDITQKTYLFYGLLVLSLITAAGTWILFRGYRRKQKIKLQLLHEEEQRSTAEAIKTAEENERKRIAADLHDNLGAYAASIAANLDQLTTPSSVAGAKALEQLRNNSQSIVSQLNDTIWVLKKDALPLTAISDRLKIFLQRLQSSYPAIRMDVKEHISIDHLLPPLQAFHLFQILQEAVNNALRHSCCSYISIGINASTGWQITVKDDGKGMPDSVVDANGGNGLSNMRHRADEAGWKISWENEDGTRVVIDSTAN